MHQWLFKFLFLHDACIYRLAITAQRCSWLTILKRCITKKQTSNVSKYFHKQSSLLQGSLNKQNNCEDNRQRMQIFNKIKPLDLAHKRSLRLTSPLFPKQSSVRSDPFNAPDAAIMHQKAHHTPAISGQEPMFRKPCLPAGKFGHSFQETPWDFYWPQQPRFYVSSKGCCLLTIKCFQFYTGAQKPMQIIGGTPPAGLTNTSSRNNNRSFKGKPGKNSRMNSTIYVNQQGLRNSV